MIPTREEIDVSNGILCAMRDEIDRLTADSISLKADAVRLQSNLDMTNAQLAKARAELAALKPSEDREAAIRAWEKEALTVESDEGIFGQGYFILRRSEITAAVALMRRADGKALLRELRAWIIDEKWCAPGIVRKIDEMLAQPAPVEQPAAAVPDDIGLGPVTDEMVQSGIAAVKDGRWITLEQLRKELAPAPDDTRELVAQLADVAAEFFVAPWCDRAKAIAAKLRGGA